VPTKKEELLAQLAEEEAREKAERDSFEVEIGSDGNYARVPYEKAKTWLSKTFGIDLDDEPRQEPEADKDDGKGGDVKRFTGGRRVG
jgi:hypothetical protein